MHGRLAVAVARPAVSPAGRFRRWRASVLLA